MPSNNQVKKPENLPENFVAAWNARAPEGIANLFAEDAEFVNVVGLWWHNKKDIFKAHDYGLRYLFNNSKLSIRKIKTKYLSDTVAVVNAKLHLEGQTAIGNQHLKSRDTIFTFVAQKTGSEWFCVSAHNTDIVPGKETNIKKEDDSIEAVSYRKRK
ncbi:SgcJ/EcaC family oxidoreductase [Marivirga sp. S37H4]|uniref:SgcJ/EcaC family oxidoreductase n=1 Tax=Marivirga aurantiaca TaxID=2802615 RepID=A0A934X121_9BACT|nr:SgcJ/EcaC family oxidoreductase [Marivirga aurantiaca]MBK6266719.1 SgcJ/EcaC family oxidoreductase [Marivirga aurantiaca]